MWRDFISSWPANVAEPKETVIVYSLVPENKQSPTMETDIPVPKFKQKKGESESSFVQRMEQETQRVLFLTKNQLQREPEKEQPTQEKSQRKKK